MGKIVKMIVLLVPALLLAMLLITLITGDKNGDVRDLTAYMNVSDSPHFEYMSPGFFFNLHPVFDVDRNVTCLFDVKTNNLTGVVITIRPYKDSTNINLDNITVDFWTSQRVDNAWKTVIYGYRLSDKRLYTMKWLARNHEGDDHMLYAGEAVQLTLAAPEYAIQPFVDGPCIRFYVYDSSPYEVSTFWDVVIRPTSKLEPVMHFSYKPAEKYDPSDPIIGLWQAGSDNRSANGPRLICYVNGTFSLLSRFNSSYVVTSGGRWEPSDNNCDYLLTEIHVYEWGGGYESSSSTKAYNYTDGKLVISSISNGNATEIWYRIGNSTEWV